MLFCVQTFNQGEGKVEEGTKIISAASTLIAFVVLIAVVWGLGGKPALSIGPAIETVIESGDTRN